MEPIEEDEEVLVAMEAALEEDRVESAASEAEGDSEREIELVGSRQISGPASETAVDAALFAWSHVELVAEKYYSSGDVTLPRKSSMAGSVSSSPSSSPRIAPPSGSLPAMPQSETPPLQTSEGKSPPEKNSRMRGTLQKQMESRQAREQLEGLLERTRKPGSWMITPEAYIDQDVARPDFLHEGNLADSKWLKALDAAIDKPAQPRPSPEKEGEEERKRIQNLVNRKRGNIQKKIDAIKNMDEELKKITSSFKTGFAPFGEKSLADKEWKDGVFRLKEDAMKALDQQADALIDIIENSLPNFIECEKRKTFLSTAINQMHIILDGRCRLLVKIKAFASERERTCLDKVMGAVKGNQDDEMENILHRTQIKEVFLDTALEEWVLAKEHYDVLRYYEAHSDVLDGWKVPDLKLFISLLGGTLTNLLFAAQVTSTLDEQGVVTLESHQFLSSQKAREMVSKANESDASKRAGMKGMPWDEQFDSELSHVNEIGESAINGIMGIIHDDSSPEKKLDDEQKSFESMLKLSRDMELVARSLEELHRRLEDKLKAANFSGVGDEEKSYSDLMTYKSDLECLHFVARGMALCARLYKDHLPRAEVKKAEADIVADSGEPIEEDEEVLGAMEAALQEAAVDAGETVTREFAAMDASAESAASETDNDSEQETELAGSRQISGPVLETAVEALPFVRDAKQYLKQAERNLKLYESTLNLCETAWTTPAKRQYETLKNEYEGKAIAEFKKAREKFKEAEHFGLGSEDLNELQECEAVLQQYEVYKHCEENPDAVMKLLLDGVVSMALPDDDEYFREGFYESVICFQSIKWKEYCLCPDPFYPHIHVRDGASGLDVLRTMHVRRAHLKTQEQRKLGQDYERETGVEVKRPEFSKRSTVILARLMARALAERETREAETLDGLHSRLPIRMVPARR